MKDKGGKKKKLFGLGVGLGGRGEGRKKIWMNNLKMKMLLNQLEFNVNAVEKSLSCDFYFYCFLLKRQ